MSFPLIPLFATARHLFLFDQRPPVQPPTHVCPGRDGCSFTMIACRRAPAMAHRLLDPRRDVKPSGIPSVPNVGMRAHIPPIFFPVCRCNFSFTRRSTKFSYALHDSNCSGHHPVRGNRRNTVVRNDFQARYFLPIQNGRTGRKAPAGAAGSSSPPVSSCR